jgi:hypothetical protein
VIRQGETRRRGKQPFPRSNELTPVPSIPSQLDDH